MFTLDTLAGDVFISRVYFILVRVTPPILVLYRNSPSSPAEFADDLGRLYVSEEK